VIVRVQGRAPEIRAQLPASIATVTDLLADPDQQATAWSRVEIRAEQLDWLPGLLASLDRPFAIEQPDELRDLVRALAARLEAAAGP
jgi:predicted DNA-binding transcriptional regulator YafY